MRRTEAGTNRLPVRPTDPESNAHVGDSATSGDDREISPGPSERADLLGRITALDHRLKHTVTAERHRAELRADREALDDLRHALREVRRSESWRLGNGIVRVLRVPVVALGTLFAPGLRRWRSSRTSRDRRYRRAITVGSLLASLDARALENRSTPAEGAIASFVQQLRMSRTDGPRVLEAEELAGLRRALAASSSEPELADRARACARAQRTLGCRTHQQQRGNVDRGGRARSPASRRVRDEDPCGARGTSAARGVAANGADADVDVASAARGRSSDCRTLRRALRAGCHAARGCRGLRTADVVLKRERGPRSRAPSCSLGATTGGLARRHHGPVPVGLPR